MSLDMLIGILRMPISQHTSPLMWQQFVDRARQAADEIEHQRENIDNLRQENSDLRGENNRLREENEVLSRYVIHQHEAETGNRRCTCDECLHAWFPEG